MVLMIQSRWEPRSKRGFLESGWEDTAVAKPETTLERAAEILLETREKFDRPEEKNSNREWRLVEIIACRECESPLTYPHKPECSLAAIWSAVTVKDCKEESHG